jgi:carboxyl-terminal processing protease
LPADQAGLQPDDIILSINGISIQGWSLDESVALLRGEVGTPVTVEIYRPSEEDQFVVDIVRERVELPTVYARMYGEIAYVRLFTFNQNATSLLEQEIANLLENEPPALILDLRSNPGGLLNQAVGVSDLFLGDGLIVTQRDQEGNETIYRSTNGDLAESIPLVVLVDGGSASASEVVAGALRDRDRAALIGHTTFGKGSVQHVHDLRDDSQLHVTVALWFTPNNTPIQGQGLAVDVDVAIPNSETLEEDPFIQAALDYLAEQQPQTSLSSDQD